MSRGTTKREASLRLLQIARAIRGALSDDAGARDWARELEYLAYEMSGLLPDDLREDGTT